MELCFGVGRYGVLAPAEPQVHSGDAAGVHLQQVSQMGGRNRPNVHYAMACNGKQTSLSTPSHLKPLFSLHNVSVLNEPNQVQRKSELKGLSRGLPSGFSGRKSDQDWHIVESTFQPPQIDKGANSRFKNPLDGAGHLLFKMNKRLSERSDLSPGVAIGQRGTFRNHSKVLVIHIQF